MKFQVVEGKGCFCGAVRSGRVVVWSVEKWSEVNKIGGKCNVTTESTNEQRTTLTFTTYGTDSSVREF